MLDSWAPRTTAIVLALAAGLAASSARAENVTLPIKPGVSAGTLLMPKMGFAGIGVVIVAGSGPTDRNGNQPTQTNNSLKMLAEGLAREGIASVRFDKRFAGKTRLKDFDEADIRFRHFADDAVRWAQYLSGRPGIERIAFIGHSQGGLVATLAATRVRADRLVLLAAPGFNIADTMKKQLFAATQVPSIRLPIAEVIEKLRRGQRVPNYRGPAANLFRSSIQPFLISWMRHDPAERLKAFEGPVLIVQGTRDLQVKAAEAARLKSAKPSATLVTVTGMNHVLKKPAAGRPANVAAYNQPALPLADGLVPALARFLTAKP